MNVFLCRHGNTFGIQDTVVWVGARNDLSLVDKGKLQALHLADSLKAQNIFPDAIYCGPLKRTKEYSILIAERLEIPIQPVIDPRLNEIDYGNWSGLTSEQITEKFGEDSLKNWELRCSWPSEWPGSDVQIFEEVQSFLRDLSIKHTGTENILVVTSNGRLRYFLKLIPEEFKRRMQRGAFKVKTGNVCKLTLSNNLPSLSYWNIEPGPDFKL